VPHDSFEQHKANKGPKVNHFYAELLLTERMHTATGSAHSRASPRHPRRFSARVSRRMERRDYLMSLQKLIISVKP
jgi:hypothetical protein